jgi:hypothetical protein
MNKSTKEYKGYKLVTHKNKNGSFTTYVFNGGVKALNNFTQAQKRHSIGIAQDRIDSNELGSL